jgi:hypothetical protein
VGLDYLDVVAYLTPKLQARGYNPLPIFDPGPAVNIDAQDVSPNMLVIIGPGPGGGFDSEMLFDKAPMLIRTVGPQMDYGTAERLAGDIDLALCYDFQVSQHVNGKWWLTVYRSGGAPALILKDEGDRYHFTCNYIFEVEYITTGG